MRYCVLGFTLAPLSWSAERWRSPARAHRCTGRDAALDRRSACRSAASGRCANPDTGSQRLGNQLEARSIWSRSGRGGSARSTPGHRPRQAHPTLAGRSTASLAARAGRRLRSRPDALELVGTPATGLRRPARAWSSARTLDVVVSAKKPAAATIGLPHCATEACSSRRAASISSAERRSAPVDGRPLRGAG
jgi:hypothetical protein